MFIGQGATGGGGGSGRTFSFSSSFIVISCNIIVVAAFF